MAIDTAGLRWAGPNKPLTKAAMATARPQPIVITIQPASLALLLSSTTPATTPLPSKTSKAVPNTSPINSFVIMHLFLFIFQIGQIILNKCICQQLFLLC